VIVPETIRIDRDPNRGVIQGHDRSSVNDSTRHAFFLVRARHLVSIRKTRHDRAVTRTSSRENHRAREHERVRAAFNRGTDAKFGVDRERC
jgi:hypothetical protein